MNDLAFLYFYERKYPEAETLLREALDGHQKAKTDTWDRYGCQSLLGASLSVQKKYAEAEAPLLSGYEGMLQRAATIPAYNRFKLEQAGTWIVQLYLQWGKPDQAATWTQKLRAAKTLATPK